MVDALVCGELFRDTAMMTPPVEFKLTIAACAATITVVLDCYHRGGDGAIWTFRGANGFAFT